MFSALFFMTIQVLFLAHLQNAQVMVPKYIPYFLALFPPLQIGNSSANCFSWLLWEETDDAGDTHVSISNHKSS